jgi:hypothetical protein
MPKSSRTRQTLFALAALAAVPLAGVSAISIARAAAPGAAPFPVVQGKLSGAEKLEPRADSNDDPTHRFTWRQAVSVARETPRKPAANVPRDVCVAAYGSSVGAHDTVTAKLTGGRITPSTIVVPPASHVSFRNVDPFAHTLYEEGNDKWGPSPMGAGATREWTATAAGVHEIRDKSAPSVVMYVVVDPAATEFALPDRDGRFAIPLPPGEYTLRVYYEGRQVGALDAVRVRDKSLDLANPIVVQGVGK